jgi:hypothetical protein
MPPDSNTRNRALIGFNWASTALRRTLLASLLMSLIWLQSLSINPALAMPVETGNVEKIAARIDDSTAEGKQMSALIHCLPKQLSQPSFKRAWSEMGDDQLQRAFNLKANPKLSQAEIELAACLSSLEL